MILYLYTYFGEFQKIKNIRTLVEYWEKQREKNNKLKKIYKKWVMEQIRKGI